MRAGLSAAVAARAAEHYCRKVVRLAEVACAVAADNEGAFG